MRSHDLRGLIVAFAVLAVVFGLMERLWPARPGQPRWRRDSRTDLVYWFFTPLVTKTLTQVTIVAAVVFIAWRAGVVPLDREHVRAFVAGQRRSALPPAVQIAAILLIGDFIGYWTHRLFHGRALWRFHAVHHGSTQVDWLSAVRLHPVNDAVAKVAQSLPLLFMGFDYTLLAGYVPFLTFYAIFLHANVPWSFGPLRYVVASPAFHRWHHTSQDEGLDKNFAGLLPMWDLLFGTFYMPRGRQPEAFGIAGERVPDGVIAQLLYPFRRTRTAA
jgi:sterol desaturase/sphingolipid hydroxylase (fatty acid hydroxylase superfamily)